MKPFVIQHRADLGVLVLMHIDLVLEDRRLVVGQIGGEGRCGGPPGFPLPLLAPGRPEAPGGGGGRLQPSLGGASVGPSRGRPRRPGSSRISQGEGPAGPAATKEAEVAGSLLSVTTLDDDGDPAGGERSRAGRGFMPARALHPSAAEPLDPAVDRPGATEQGAEATVAPGMAGVEEQEDMGAEADLRLEGPSRYRSSHGRPLLGAQVDAASWVCGGCRRLGEIHPVLQGRTRFPVCWELFWRLLPGATPRGPGTTCRLAPALPRPGVSARRGVRDDRRTSALLRLPEGRVPGLEAAAVRAAAGAAARGPRTRSPVRRGARGEHAPGTDRQRSEGSRACEASQGPRSASPR